MKRILAIITIIILVGLYIVTLVAAVMGTPTSNTLFMASLMASVLLPVLLWAMFYVYDLLKAHREKLNAKAKNELEDTESSTN